MSLWTDFLGVEIRYVQTPGFGRVRIAEAGRGNRESLLLMHGIGGHIEAYAKNVTELSRDFHVVAFDFVGHGLSEKRTDIVYQPTTYAAQLSELMDVLGIEAAHISGESLGGWVAGEFALRHPSRVKRLVLNTTGGIPIVTDKGRQDLKDLSELSRRNFGQAPTIESVRLRMQWLMHSSNWGLLTDELIQTRLQIYLRPDFQKSAPLVFAALGRIESNEQAIALLDLERIEQETLFLWTRHNPVHDVDAAQQACARVRRSSLYVMKAEAAHWPQYEAPGEFNTTMKQFLLDGCVADSVHVRP